MIEPEKAVQSLAKALWLRAGKPESFNLEIGTYSHTSDPDIDHYTKIVAEVESTDTHELFVEEAFIQTQVYHDIELVGTTTEEIEI